MSEQDTALGQALVAYAGVTSGEALDAARVRSRILQSARAPRRRSLRGLSLALPLVAVFAASAAFAASQPAWRAAIRTSFAVLVGGVAAPSPTSPQHAPGHRAEPAKAVPAAPTAPAADAEASSGAQAPIAIDALPLAAPASAGSTRAFPPRSRPAAKAAGVAPAPSTPNADFTALEAYRLAHRTHFDGGSPSASLAAWDLYLANFPTGSFADDARFNRALCLIRLGRRAEARAALGPFANAPAGSYRQTEAASLLQGLGSSQP